METSASPRLRPTLVDDGHGCATPESLRAVAAWLRSESTDALSARANALADSLETGANAPTCSNARVLATAWARDALPGVRS